MRKKAIVLLLVLALALWSVPTLALANDVTSSGEVGTTEASATFEDSTSASASAASSVETGDSAGPVAASASWEGEAPSEDSDSDSGEDVVVDNGGGSTTQIGNFNTIAGAQIDPDDAAGVERVSNVTVTAPDDFTAYASLARIDGSEGRAHVGFLEGAYYSTHGVTGVHLFDNEGDDNDGIIKFEGGYAVAQSWFEDGSPAAYSEIIGLFIWDPDISDYVDFGNFNSDDSIPLADINTLLAKSNLFMHHLVAVLVDGTDAAVYTSASLMAILYPYPPGGIYTGEYQLWLELANVSSETKFDGEVIIEAWARGTELSFNVPQRVEPGGEPTVLPGTGQVAQQQPQAPAQVAQAQVQPVQLAQAQPAPSRGAGAELPATGFNYLWLLLGAGLVLTGLRLRRI